MKPNYLQRAGKWVWLALVLPVLCVAGALVQLGGSADSWTGSANVLTSPALTDRSGAQYVNDVQAALVSDAVVGRVAEQVDVSPGRVRAGLSSRVLAPGSSVLGVEFADEDRALAERVPETAARAALLALVQPQLERSQAQVRSAEDDSERALLARDAFTQQTGVELPLQSYNQGLAEVAQLRVAAATARFEGRDGASGLAQLLSEREEEVAGLAPQVPEFEALDAEVQRTYLQLNQVRTALVSAQAEVSAIESGPTVVANAPVAASQSRAVVQRIASAAVVGLLAALVLLAVIVFVFRRPRGHAEAPVTEGGRSAGAADQPVRSRTRGDAGASAEEREPVAPGRGPA